MSRSYLASDVIASVKRRSLLSASGATPFADSDWYVLMDEEIRGYIWPLLRGVHEDFFVRRHDISVVAGTQEYRFPRRMLGESLKAVLQSDGSGRYRKLNRIRSEEQARGEYGFWFEDDRIILNPTPDAQMARPLRILYHLRPSKPVAATAGTVAKCEVQMGANLRGATGETWSNSTTAIVDVVHAVPGLRPLLMDVALDDVDPGPPLEFQGDFSALDVTPSGLEPVYVCLAEETPIPNIPFELFPLLSQQLAMLALSCRAGYAEAKDRRDKMEASAKLIFANRDEGNDEVVQNYNAPGWARRRSNVVTP